MTGESIIFWLLAPLTVAAALGMLFVKKAMHSAILLAFVMISLAVFYLIQDAPFLGIVQIVVYTGAVMMLFLFILMLVGVDSSDSLEEVIKGQRVGAILGSIGIGFLLISLLSRAELGRQYSGLELINGEGNVQAIAKTLFTRYVWAFEVISALLITAALGAMVLAHRERLFPRKSQRELAAERDADVAGFQQAHRFALIVSFASIGTMPSRMKIIDTMMMRPSMKCSYS
mgnify:CR=1 FL=1